jgi:hypothetical protein
MALAPPKNAMASSAGCAPNTKPPIKLNPPKPPSKVWALKKKQRSLHPSNSKNSPPNPKPNSPPSATYSAAAAVNGQPYKSPANLPDATPRKNWTPLGRTAIGWNGLESSFAEMKRVWRIGNMQSCSRLHEATFVCHSKS